MALISTYLEGQDLAAIIENEVLFLDNLKDVQQITSDLPVKIAYNAIIHCRRGKILVELGGIEQIHLEAGQLLLVPAQKLVQPMMVSTDVEASALFISDRVLKSVLGSQLEIWNRAMYLHETYVIDCSQWSESLESYSHNVFNGKELKLMKEMILAFIRISLLIICEELLRNETDKVISSTSLRSDNSGNREKTIFNRFLDLLAHEPKKRQHVSYYAGRLCISPKYLSTVCQKASGKSPLRWITDSVMEDCYDMLRNTDLSVKEISNRLDFPNASFFGQYFREQAGMTPLEYRNKTR